MPTRYYTGFHVNLLDLCHIWQRVVIYSNCNIKKEAKTWKAIGWTLCQTLWLGPIRFAAVPYWCKGNMNPTSTGSILCRSVQLTSTNSQMPPTGQWGGEKIFAPWQFPCLKERGFEMEREDRTRAVSPGGWQDGWVRFQTWNVNDPASSARLLPIFRQSECNIGWSQIL